MLFDFINRDGLQEYNSFFSSLIVVNIINMYLKSKLSL
jgi:hypothetical protein